jgi:hypothetical protein
MAKKSKPKTNRKQTHTPRTEYGLGDYYGTGRLQPLAKIRSGMGQEILSPKKLKKPPRSLV